MGKISKETLDQLMKEYDWDKNDLEDTFYFIDYMFKEYGKLYIKQIEKEEENA